MEWDGTKKVQHGISKNVVSLHLLVLVELRHDRGVGLSATFCQSNHILVIHPGHK